MQQEKVVGIEKLFFFFFFFFFFLKNGRLFSVPRNFRLLEELEAGRRDLLLENPFFFLLTGKKRREGKVC
jgi:hypothetical protein